MLLTQWAGTGDSRAIAWPTILLYAALPTIGLAAGPSYAPMIFGVGVVHLIHGMATQRRFPSLDGALLALALTLAALGWASALWAIAPKQTLLGALQLTAILAASLVFLSARRFPPERVRLLFQVTLAASFLGMAVVSLDIALAFPLHRLVAIGAKAWVATKYNRGLDYLVLIAWPLLAYYWTMRRVGERILAALFGLLLIVALLLGSSLSGQVAGVAGAVILVFALAAPRWLPRVLAVGTAVVAIGVPFILRGLSLYRGALASHIKPSGVHRLEIWNYMTARVLERPLFGWGLSSAKFVPITPAELQHYTYANADGIYPHNQWLELWIDLGAVGAAIGLIFALLVLRRIGHLRQDVRPFAYAGFASAMAVSLVNFEVTTDSWWAALAAGAALFTLLDRSCRQASPSQPA
ncbi:MAG TPA: O-antigen ligase family protein [Stellaceae bacterium]|nr:O-antigen ligase family protein [Stellaceae bacterium]